MLSKRLNKVLTYINNTDKLVDVGCDHGYLAIEAINKGVKLVQLVDNKTMPLDCAKHNLEKLNRLQDVEVIFTLASGLTKIDDRINVATVTSVIFGIFSMRSSRTKVRTQIIEESFEKAKALDSLILQANTKVEHLRLYLINKGFTIIDESFIKDKNKYYPIIVAKYSGAVSKLTSTQIKYGPIILIKKEDDFIDYLNDRLVHLNNICKNNQKLLNEIKEIEEIMKDETCGNN